VIIVLDTLDHGSLVPRHSERPRAWRRRPEAVRHHGDTVRHLDDVLHAFTRVAAVASKLLTFAGEDRAALDRATSIPGTWTSVP